MVQDLGVGGTQRCAQNYAIALSTAGLESMVFAYRSGGPRHQSLVESGLQVVVSSLSDALRWKPDVIHIHRTGLQESDSGRVIDAFADIGSRVIETNVFGKPDYSRTARRIALHMQISEWSLWKWRERTSMLNPEPLGILFPYAIDGSRFSPLTAAERRTARERQRIPEGAVTLGRVGQPLEAKWEPEIVETFTSVAAANPDIFLVLVGPPPSVRQRAENLNARLRARVRLIDPVASDSDLRELYGCIDVFVHNARIGESFGMVIVEALLCGIPVVTRIRPLRDNTQALLVKHGVTGILAASTAGMARAVSEVVRSLSAFQERVLAARAALLDEYSVQSLTEPLANIVRAAAFLDARAFQAWCRANYKVEPDARYLFGSMSLAYGICPVSAPLAVVANNPILYRIIAGMKYNGR